MKYKLLGRTGVQVSQLCFGTMSFGGDADEATSGAMYKACRDAGINFFDTANEYNKGVSEEILGRLIQGHRNDLVLTTKVNAQIRPDLNARGTSRRHVIEAIEHCLKRLQTDRIDVLFLHRYDAHRLASIQGLTAQEAEPGSTAALEIGALWEWFCSAVQPGSCAVVHRGAA